MSTGDRLIALFLPSGQKLRCTLFTALRMRRSLYLIMQISCARKRVLIKPGLGLLFSLQQVRRRIPESSMRTGWKRRKLLNDCVHVSAQTTRICSYSDSDQRCIRQLSHSLHFLHSEALVWFCSDEGLARCVWCAVVEVETPERGARSFVFLLQLLEVFCGKDKLQPHKLRGQKPEPTVIFKSVRVFS